MTWWQRRSNLLDHPLHRWHLDDSLFPNRPSLSQLLFHLGLFRVGICIDLDIMLDLVLDHDKFVHLGLYDLLEHLVRRPEGERSKPLHLRFDVESMQTV